MPESIRSKHSSGKIANSNPAPRVVILGAGFAGLTAAQRLAGAPVDVTVIDRHNYHLFQPLLYQVATAALSPADIATPIRGILGRHDNIEVLLDTVTGIDRDEQCVRTLSGRCIPYDYLVIATGATHSYFGNDEWAEVAPGLKRIEDATHVRRRILLAFEKAEMSDDPDEREALLTFVIVGGGPTGVEMAGAVAELARFTLARDFRHIKPGAARIILIEAGSRVLKAFPERLSERARQSLENMGVDVRLNERVTEITSRHVAIDDHRIPARTTIWGAGVQASPAGDWLNAETDRSGRIIVDSQLRVPGDDRIYALGDTACCEDANGIVSPGLAPAAKQIRGTPHSHPGRGPASAATVSLPRLGPAGHHRAQVSGCRLRQDAPVGPSGLVALGWRSHLLPGRLSQPIGGRRQLVLVLPHLRAWYPPDHRRRLWQPGPQRYHYLTTPRSNILRRAGRPSAVLRNCELVSTCGPRKQFRSKALSRASVQTSVPPTPHGIEQPRHTTIPTFRRAVRGPDRQLVPNHETARPIASRNASARRYRY